jgi:UDP-N-acetyl-2-amino-2-deoxyglucuronate dehydrogenase
MVLISLEASKAPPAVRAALQAGCHVLAEKPACVRVEDFRSLARLAEQQDRHLMLALANRLNDEVEAAGQLIRENKIGRIFGIEMHLVADQTRLTRPAYQQSWYASKERAGGGHLIWLGIHWLDLAMHLTGSSIREVNAMIANVGGQPIDVEDSAVLACRFDNGALGTFTSGYYLDSGYHSHIKIWGSTGWLEIQAHGETPLKWASGLDKEAGIQTLRFDQKQRGYTPLVRACVLAAIGQGAPPLTTDDSLRAIETVFAAYRASESGCREVIER